MGGQLLTKQELNDALNLHLDGSGVSYLPKTDERDAVDLLADAFADDPMFVWVAGLDEDDPKADQKMHDLGVVLQAYVNRRILNGSRGTALGIRSSAGEEEQLVSCMTLVPSSRAKPGIFDNFVTMIKYGVPPMYKSKESFGPHSQKRLEKLAILEELRREHMKGTERWIYLQTIGVRPDHQGKGCGGKMLRLLLQTADSLGASLYLETESEGLESMYKKFGFDTIQKLDMFVQGDDTPTAHFDAYLMRRNPK